MTLWNSILPVLQQINNAGGYGTQQFISRAVIDAIDHLADSGDATLAVKRSELINITKRGRWPNDPQHFKALFEAYHEALFYILAHRKGIHLAAVPRSATPTPDFATTQVPVERFELKTIDFSGGEFAYRGIMAEGHNIKAKAQQEAKRRGVGFGVQEIRPHADATNIKEAIERVMGQIGGNIKMGQFALGPTYLVVPMIRTAVRSREEELIQSRHDDHLGGRLSGHLWTIAAAPIGEHFHDAPYSLGPTDLGPLNRAGILNDFPFVAGVIFIDTKWSKLGSADFEIQFPDNAFRLFGIWNERYVPVGPSTAATSSRGPGSAFAALCDAWKPSDQSRREHHPQWDRNCNCLLVRAMRFVTGCVRTIC